MTPRRKEPKWIVIGRAIILVIIAIALVCGVLLSSVTRSYAYADQHFAETRFIQSEAARLCDQRPVDFIENRPISEFATVTTDIPDIESDYAALGTKEGEVLFARDAQTPMPMASTTKIMTAVVALERVPLDAPMTVTIGATRVGGSEAGLEAGMTLLFSDALYALMVPSGNDAAVVIAENTAGTEGKFVTLMNEKAAELGMTKTHFADASGLSAEDHYTTAADYLKVTAYAMRIPVFREVVATQYKEILVEGKTLYLNSTDRLFDVLDEGEALGVKTGFIDEAGYCFVGAARKGQIELYAVVLHAPDDMTRFMDAALLLEWGFRHYRVIELINTTQQVAIAPCVSWLDKTVSAYAPEAVSLEMFDLNGRITQTVELEMAQGDVARGQVIGRLIWEYNGEVLTISKLISAEEVAAPDFWMSVQIWWSRLWGGFFGAPAHAEAKVLLPSSVPVPREPRG